MSSLISVHELHKYFGSNHAVRGLSFEIKQGICLGLLGPNGAGKTTTIEILEGIKSPSSGEILYRERPLTGAHKTDYKSRIGIQFQATALMDYLSVTEVLKLFGGFYADPMPVDELVGLCDLSEFAHQHANRISGGQRQRLLLAIALVNNPEILFLDEPTTGLDPQSRRNFWTLINRIKLQGKTVVLTTHYMDEAQTLCDELLIVDYGSMVAQGSPEALLEQHFDSQQVWLEEMPGIEVEPELAIPGTIGDMPVFETRKPADLIGYLVENGFNINGLQVRSPTLEDLFLKLTGHALRD